MTKANQEPRCIETVLEMDGILAKGYGVVAKIPMRDTELKIKDKGLYAYLCSLSGGGVRTWPSRGKILADLQIGKEAFYSSLERLISLGYLSKTSRRLHGDSGMWTRTVYTIELNPKGRTIEAEEQEPGDGGSLSVEGILGDGWGFAPRLVMTDTRLSIREKALYAYILTYAAVGKVRLSQGGNHSVSPGHLGSVLPVYDASALRSGLHRAPPPQAGQRENGVL